MPPVHFFLRWCPAEWCSRDLGVVPALIPGACPAPPALSKEKRTARRVVAVDGDVVRGSRTGTAAAIQLLTAMEHHGVVLAQQQIVSESNEIPSFQPLLDTLELTGTVLTTDALHTQHDHGTYLNGRGAHYLATIKKRHPGLYAQVSKLPWRNIPLGHRTGPGAKGHPYYDWAVIDLTPGHRQLLIRRSRTTGELAYYRCHSTGPAPMRTPVRTAGSRWLVKETFQTGKGLAGLDEHQVRRYPSWSRWVTLAMLAHAFLAVVRADEHTRRTGPGDLAASTCNVTQHLFLTIAVRPLNDLTHRIAWSDWRRRHQARSQASHYRRQAAAQT
ncbi:ISAs1 family transposase [Streptomyces sp. NPDC056653]|uniref:ISAs1 family transposase n=1 Tax=Streptomyces sp. NPDC056653 TaxID=3345894 RepID=UPI0036B5E061